MSDKTTKKDWLEIKLEQVFKKYNLNPEDGMVELLKKAAKVIPTSQK